MRFDCQRLEVFEHAVEAVAVIDDLVEEFSMRGLHKARGEWALVSMSHNMRRLHAARVAGRVAPTR